MIRALLNCERGNSFIEMALATPVFVGLLVGMVDISRGVSAKLQVVQAAQRTVELVQRTGFNHNQMANYETEAETAAGTGSSATATAWLECGSSTTRLAYTGSCTPGEAYSRHMDVTVAKNFTPLFGTEHFPGANSDGTFTVRAKAGVRIQ
jgi:Flp pilus assembly protein TadG